ncbi:hypothetical protein WA026_002869 [Henosepilachna vigintioctopunctata]|uniref:Uncharacterized protein n=1 Tax=Henosepilachna vigintioctopunctata TaxID=420089 RepID=A0AAW1TGU0_9CUCU
MAENVESKNKRKRKKSFLKNARKYAKKGNLGVVLYWKVIRTQYFVRIMEAYREGFDNNEDGGVFVKQTFCVFRQTENQEIDGVCNQVGCRVIEILLPFANEVLKRYMNGFSENLRPLCSDKLASHVLEELVTQACKRSVIENEMREEYKNFTVKISKFMLNNLEDFMWDTCGNHIVRICLRNFTHIPKEEKSSKYNTSSKAEIKLVK